MKQKIHVFGASGSGTTTIARCICDALGYQHFDTDKYYWEPTDEPFTVARPIEERIRLLEHDLGSHKQWVLSGALAGWGSVLVPHFDLVIFVYVPTDIRVERLKKREYERYGDAVLPGGRRHDATNEFIDWAASYDTGMRTGRNLPNHKKWIETLPCEVLKITNISLKESVSAALDAIKA